MIADLNAAYVALLRKDRSIVSDQRRWLLNVTRAWRGPRSRQRDGCISEAYRQRTDRLWQIAGREPDLCRGGTPRLRRRANRRALCRTRIRTFAQGFAPLVLVEQLANHAGGAGQKGAHLGRDGCVNRTQLPPRPVEFARRRVGIRSDFRLYGASEPCLPTFRVLPIVKFEGRHLDVGPASGDDHFNDYLTAWARAGSGRFVQLLLAGCRTHSSSVGMLAPGVPSLTLRTLSQASSPKHFPTRCGMVGRRCTPPSRIVDGFSRFIPDLFRDEVLPRRKRTVPEPRPRRRRPLTT